MTGTPEERLSTLIDLSARLAHVAALNSWAIPDAVLTDVGKALGEQMRAVAAELGKAPPAPVAPREFKVGDRVRVVSNIDRIAEGWDEVQLGEEGRIICSDASSPACLCWYVQTGDDVHFHSSRELELIEG